MSLVDAQKDMKDLLPFNDECGYDHGSYSWNQSDAEVNIRVPLPENTAPKTLDVRIDTNNLFIAFSKKKSDDAPVLAGKLFKPIKAEESTWSVEDRKVLVVTLTKSNRQYEEWWPHVVTSEPQLDIKTLKPPSKHMRELDQGAQAQIQKMMFDQEQQRKGLPNSDQMMMQEAMKKAAGPPPQQQQQS